MSPSRVTVTGASGLIGRALVQALAQDGSQITVLSRDPERARALLGSAAGEEPEFRRWDPMAGPAPHLRFSSTAPRLLPPEKEAAPSTIRKGWRQERIHLPPY